MKKENRFHQREVADLLKTFNKEERKKFSTYLNERGSSNVVRLWTLLRKRHPEYKIKDAVLYQQVKPEKAYNDKMYRLWITELYSHARAFVAICEFEGNEALYANTMAMGLLRRDARRAFEKKLKEQDRMLGEKNKHNVDYYQYRYQLEDIRYQSVTLYDHRGTTDSLQLTADFFDNYFLLYKLKYLLGMHTRERIVKEPYTYRLEAEILAYLEKNPRKEPPLLHLYYLLVRLMADLENRVLFQEFITFFRAHNKEIDSIESRQLLTSGINICYWNIELGNFDYLQDRFLLVKILVAGGYAVARAHFVSHHFRNAIRVAIEAGQVDWAKQFLTAELANTNPDDQENLRIFSLAYLHFALGEYEEESIYLQQMAVNEFRFIDLYSEMDYRSLQLKTAYIQLDQKSNSLANEAFSAQLDSFRNFLSRRALPENALLAANNFHKVLRQFHQKKQGKVLRVGDLRAYILGLKPIRELPWLIREANLLVDSNNKTKY